jgi:hypothetical protein
MVLEAYVDERGLVQVFSATPATEADPVTAAPAAASPQLLSTSSGSVDRKWLRLKVLRDRRHELEKTGATDTLGAVADQVAELEAEIEAQQDHGGHV